MVGFLVPRGSENWTCLGVLKGNMIPANSKIFELKITGVQAN